MSAFQILSVLFALFMLYTVKIHANKNTINKSEKFLWYSVWILFITLAVFPGLLTGLSNELRFSRVFDLLVVVAFMIVSVVTFNNYFSEKKLRQKLEDSIRKDAIESTKKISK